MMGTKLKVNAARDKSHMVPRELPRFVKAATVVYFCLAGFCGLLGLNVLIVISPILEEDLWPTVRFSDLLMLTAQFGSLVTGVGLVCSKGAALSPTVGKVVAAIAVTAFFMYPVPALFIDPDDPLASVGIARGLYVFLAFCTGVGSATAQTQGYAYCGMCKAIPDASKLVALGFAMSGLYVWVHFALARQYLFPDPSIHHQNIFVMIYVSSFCALSYIALRYCLGIMTRHIPGFEQSIHEALEATRAAKKNSTMSFSHHSNHSTKHLSTATTTATVTTSLSVADIANQPQSTQNLEEGPHDYDSFQRQDVCIVKDTSGTKNFMMRMLDNDVWRLYRPAFTAMLTFFVFPTVGPYSWPVVNKYYYVGVFQVGDLFGRLYVSMYICDDDTVNYLIAYRMFFIVPCYLAAFLFPSTPVLTSTAFLVFLSVNLVISHSLSFASAAVRAVRISKGDPLKAESIATRLSLSCILGVLIGIASCKMVLHFR